MTVVEPSIARVFIDLNSGWRLLGSALHVVLHAAVLAPEPLRLLLLLPLLVARPIAISSVARVVVAVRH